jgi:hypothetical protein
MFGNVHSNLIMLALKDLISTLVYSNLDVTIDPQQKQFVFYAYDIV